MTTSPRSEDDGPELAGLRDALTRVVWIRDELDPLAREQALEDLEQDVAARIEQLKDGRAA